MIWKDKIQRILFHQEDRGKQKGSTKIQLVSTLFMIVSSILPYADMFIDLFIDSKTIPVPRFQNLSYMIWAYGVALSPLLVVAISKFFNPPLWSYIFFIYVNVSSVLAYVYIQFNITIDSDWVFRFINFLLSILLLTGFKLVYNKYKENLLRDEIMEEFVKHRKDYEC